MEVRARLRGYRMGARKGRLVVDQIRNKKTDALIMRRRHSAK